MNVWAPGRINLIGEHTDYSGGLVLPAAIELGLAADVHSRSAEIRLSSTTFGEAQPFAADGSGPPTHGWARFGQAVAAELDQLGRPAVGLTATISSTLPAGAGLSSSAALEVVIALALCAAADFDVEPLELASACRRAELRAVEVPCGILDQAACILGEPNAAILIDCSSLQHTLVPVPADAAFLVVDSGISRELAKTGYADRQRELETALASLGASRPRELDLEDLEPLEPLLTRRLRHVVTENARVRQFAVALEAADLPMAGRIMSASHASLRDDYEVSLPDIDELVAAAEDCGAYGARLVGGGFGGAVLALVKTSRATEIARMIRRTHRAGRAPIVVHASRGAHINSAARAVG
ncbi:MAG TPA: galactokinase family protein [Gaiellaceae bacterium]|nr:galactokinase family protein [Gaiellaceae bacterium]